MQRNSDKATEIPLRFEAAWMALATSSLPTPVSPNTRILKSERCDQIDFFAQVRHC